MKILITGAAGNLGGLLAKHLSNDSQILLHLMMHKKNICEELRNKTNIQIFKADLAQPETLIPVVKDVDVIVHFAGVLFKHHPEKFLPLTNTMYFKNLLDTAIQCKTRRIILISFPHVEGETTISNPAKGCLNRNPDSVHAKTRLRKKNIYLSNKLNTILKR